MPLGFGPISSAPLGGSPRMGLSAQQPGGVIGQANPTGLSASAFLTNVTVSIRVNVFLSQIAPDGMRSRLGILGSLSATSPQMTVFTEGTALAGSAPSGFTAGTQLTGSFISPSSMLALLGNDFAGFAPTAYVSLGGMTMALGSVGSGDPWVEILPVTSPGWTEIVIQ